MTEAGRGPDGDVVETVAVHVPRPVHGGPGGQIAGGAANRDPSARCRLRIERPRVAASKDHEGAAISSESLGVADHHIAEAISIHVPCSRGVSIFGAHHLEPAPSESLEIDSRGRTAAENHVGLSIHTAGRAPVDAPGQGRRAGIRDDQVVETVAVHVPGPVDFRPGLGIHPARDDPEASRPSAARLPVTNGGPPKSTKAPSVVPVASDGRRASRRSGPAVNLHSRHRPQRSRRRGPPRLCPRAAPPLKRAGPPRARSQVAPRMPSRPAP